MKQKIDSIRIAYKIVPIANLVDIITLENFVPIAVEYLIQICSKYAC